MRTFKLCEKVLNFGDDTGQLGFASYPQGQNCHIPPQSETLVSAWELVCPDGRDYVGLVELFYLGKY